MESNFNPTTEGSIMTNATSPRYISTADTAKLIREALKEAFSDHRFSVRSKTYSMGASVTVSWVDGPTEARVNLVVGGFSGSSFDGMTDCKSYHTSELKGEQVHFGADCVFTARTISKGTAAQLKVAIVEAAGTEYDANRSVEVSIIEGSALPCHGAREYMACLARRLFNVTGFPHTKTKLEVEIL